MNSKSQIFIYVALAALLVVNFVCIYIILNNLLV